MTYADAVRDPQTRRRCVEAIRESLRAQPLWVRLWMRVMPVRVYRQVLRDARVVERVLSAELEDR